MGKYNKKVNFKKILIFIFEIIFLLFLHIKYNSLTDKPLFIDFSTPLPFQQAASQDVIKSNDNTK